MKPVTQAEFDALIADPTKRIEGSIVWEHADKTGTRFEFRVRVTNEAGDVLTVKGQHNRTLGKTSYTLFTGERIFGIDYDRSHGEAGRFHIHKWDASRQKAEAEKASASIEIGEDPLRLWSWFCTQAGITHNGVLESLPPIQGSLFDTTKDVPNGRSHTM